jgi:hypothetical protein
MSFFLFYWPAHYDLDPRSTGLYFFYCQCLPHLTCNRSIPNQNTHQKLKWRPCMKLQRVEMWRPWPVLLERTPPSCACETPLTARPCSG